MKRFKHLGFKDMGKMKDEITKVAAALNLYFIYGGTDLFKKFDKQCNSLLVPKKEMPEWISKELAIKSQSFIEIAYKKWNDAQKLSFTDNEKGERYCYNMISDCYSLL